MKKPPEKNQEVLIKGIFTNRIHSVFSCLLNGMRGATSQSKLLVKGDSSSRCKIL